MSYNSEDYPVGINEVAIVLKVKPATVSTWNSRKRMPEPDAYINKGGTKLWRLGHVVEWANATGRNNDGTTVDKAFAFLSEYQEKMGLEKDRQAGLNAVEERSKRLESNWYLKEIEELGKWKDLP